MTGSKDSRPLAIDPNSQINRLGLGSAQQTPSQSYFSSSPSPPPSSPLPQPPTTQNCVPFFDRAISNASKRRKIVDCGRQQLEIQRSAHTNGEPIPAFDCSSLSMDDFVQEFSNENAIERFSVCDWVDDSNVVHARVAMAELEKHYAVSTIASTSTKST